MGGSEPQALSRRRGTVTQVRGGQQVSVIGEYNGEWRMVQEQEWQNTFFIQASQLR